MDHVRGAPNHPQIRGEIERWHRILKNQILLENDYLPRELVQVVVDLHKHLIHMSLPIRVRAHPAHPVSACFSIKYLAEPVPPEASCLVADLDAPFVE